MGAMTDPAAHEPAWSPEGWLLGLGRSLLRWLQGWWQMLFIGAQLVVLAFSPSSWREHERGAHPARGIAGRRRVVPDPLCNCEGRCVISP